MSIAAREQPGTFPLPDTPVQDVGLAVINHIHQRLMIDERWTVRRSRGFTWVAHRLAQSIDASPAFESRALPVWSIAIRTPLVHEVRADRSRVERLLAELNRNAVGSALLYDAEIHQIQLLAAQLVHQEVVAGRAEQLAAWAILQLSEGERTADSLAGMCNGVVATAEHPAEGARTVPDEMLHLVRDLFAPAGREPSRFSNEMEMKAVFDFVRSTPFASLGSNAETVCVEVCLGESWTTLIEIRSDVAHRWLGNGLAITTWLPLSLGHDVYALATSLGRDQFLTPEGGSGIGAWSVRRREHDGKNYTAWNRFIPNDLCQSGLILDAAIGELNRAVWVDSLLCPGLPSRNAWALLASRVSKPVQVPVSLGH